MYKNHGLHGVDGYFSENGFGERMFKVGYEKAESG
jgi:hypothetical protein